MSKGDVSTPPNCSTMSFIMMFGRKSFFTHKVPGVYLL